MSKNEQAGNKEEVKDWHEFNRGCVNDYGDGFGVIVDGKYDPVKTWMFNNETAQYDAQEGADSQT